MNSASKVKKTIIAVRHSSKDGDKITQAGFRLIEEKANEIIGNHKITIGFHSPTARTYQTLSHLFQTKQISARVAGIEGLLPEVIDTALNSNLDEFMSVWKKTGSFIEAMDIVFGKDVEEYKRLCGEGIKECFNKMEDGDTAVVIGHHPYITYAANNLSNGAVPLKDFAELEFVTFVQYEDGTISVQ